MQRGFIFVTPYWVVPETGVVSWVVRSATQVDLWLPLAPSGWHLQFESPAIYPNGYCIWEVSFVRDLFLIYEEILTPITLFWFRSITCGVIVEDTVFWPFRSLLSCLLAYFSSISDSSITHDWLLAVGLRSVDLHYSVRISSILGLLIGARFNLKCLARFVW